MSDSKLSNLVDKPHRSTSRRSARINPQSTGPTTPAGKAKSSLNALKTALTGRTVLLPTDDVAAYQQHCANIADHFEPVGPYETALVQSVADTWWRILRVARLETSIYAVGYEQSAALVAHHDPALQPNLIEAHTYLTYEKQLRNLQIQEGRLRRQRERDLAELHQLQSARARAEREAAREAEDDLDEFEFAKISVLPRPNPTEPSPEAERARREAQRWGVMDRATDPNEHQADRKDAA